MPQRSQSKTASCHQKIMNFGHESKNKKKKKESCLVLNSRSFIQALCDIRQYLRQLSH